MGPSSPLSIERNDGSEQCMGQLGRHHGEQLLGLSLRRLKSAERLDVSAALKEEPYPPQCLLLCVQAAEDGSWASENNLKMR